MRFIILILISLQIAFCSRKDSKVKQHQRLEVDIKPAFSEMSVLKLGWSGDTPNLNILILNDIRVDKNEDTFYYKNVVLDGARLSFFDSLINDWPQPWTPHAITVLDGIHITYMKYGEHDTAKLELHGPSFRSDSLGYRMTSSLFNKLDSCFQDSLIIDYFQELRSYIQDDSAILNTNRQALFERRENKYGWKYRR